MERRSSALRSLSLTGVVVLAAAWLALAYWGLGPVSVSAQGEGVERTEYRHPPPSCEEIVNSPQWQGKEVNCIESPPPTYDPPRMHGEYRLYPGSYVGPLTYVDMPDTAPPGVVSHELNAIRTSSIYVEPGWLPAGYAISSIGTRDSDSEHIILAVYAGPGESIHINRIRRLSWPIDIIYPDDEPDFVIETPTLDGREAVLTYEKPGSSWSRSEFSLILRFVDGDAETIVYGAELDPETATRIALSLICGDSCLPPSGITPEALPATGHGPEPSEAPFAWMLAAAGLAGVGAAVLAWSYRERRRRRGRIR